MRPRPLRSAVMLPYLVPHLGQASAPLPRSLPTFPSAPCPASLSWFPSLPPLSLHRSLLLRSSLPLPLRSRPLLQSPHQRAQVCNSRHHVSCCARRRAGGCAYSPVG